MRTPSPCYGCTPPKRTISCHSTCSDYIKWANEQRDDEKKAKVRAESEAINFLATQGQRVRRRQNEIRDSKRR